MINKNIDLKKIAKENSNKYICENPYPHIVIDNFFDEEILTEVLKEFKISESKETIFNNPNEKKITLNRWEDFGKKTFRFIQYLNSNTFLSFLEELTGINKLIADESLEGGGLHQIDSGGYLKIHADFNKHGQSNLDRRINVLIYLNKGWDEKWGGKFELWSNDVKNCIKKVTPIFNRMVIFSTTSQSYHGHPSPLNTPKKISRKSIAMYYYTDGRPKHEIEDGLKYHSTLFKNRPNKSGDRKMYYYNNLKKLLPKELIKSLLPSKVIDKLIHNKRKN